MAPKAKAKKPWSMMTAKAKAKVKEQKAAEKAEKQAKIESGEIAAPAPKNDPFKKKVLAALGGKSVSEAADEFKKRSQICQAELQEAQAMEKAQAQQVAEAQVEYEKAKAEIEAATKEEMAAAAAYKAIVSSRSEVGKAVSEARNELYEAQKKVAMMEVLSVNKAKMKILEETRLKAQQAAEDARKNMLEQKQREKEALEATRKALAETRAEQKGMGKGMAAISGKKRKGEVHPDEAETLPAMLADGSQPADID